MHLADIVNDAVELVGSLFAQRQQALQVDVADDLPGLVGDGPRLVQVFVNLLANANKFGPEGSTVRISARAVDGAVRATVDDEGPGVLENDQGSIFERFYRAADAGTGATRPRPRPVDREVDRRAPWRPGRGDTHRGGAHRASSSRCRSRGRTA